MPDLIIRPESGETNRLVLQDQAGNDVLTTADSGATLNSPTLVTPALGTPASGVVTNLTGTLGTGINNAEGGIFKHIKIYRTSTYNTSTNGAETIINWTKQGSPWADVGTDFGYSSGEFTFPAAGIWLIMTNVAFYVSGNGLGANMEAQTAIYDGSSWVGSVYIRVGQQYDGSSYTRGGGSQPHIYDIPNTNYKWRVRFSDTISGKTVADSTQVTFIYLSQT